MSKLVVHTERELLSMLTQGNEYAFDAIYNQYASDLYRYAYSRLGSQEDSEDLIQSVFTALWERRKHAEKITALRYYLYCSVRYQLITHHKALTELTIRRKEYANHATILDNSNLDHQNLKDTELIIQRTIASLPERVQTAFRLSREQHLSNEKIALRMNISQRAVENYITEALKSLRSSMGEAIILAIWLGA